jgi:hypothetical protein
MRSTERLMKALFKPVDDSIIQIHDQLAHLEKIKSEESSTALGSVQLLSREQISMLINTAFWASLQFDEGRPTRFCVSVADPEDFHDAVAFAVPVPYGASQIARLSPAAPQGGCLVVSESGDGLNIWGFGHSRPGTGIDTVTIDVWEPGTVRVGVGPFRTFAVLSGRADEIVEGTDNNLPSYLQRVLSKTLPTDDILETQAVWRECQALRDLVRMIVADGHGGIVLVVPSETGTWSGSLNPFEYCFAAPDTTIGDAIRQELHDGRTQGERLQRLLAADLPDDIKNLVASEPRRRSGDIERAVRAIASLTAVDGAIVITRDMRVLGFGAKIAVDGNAAPKVCMFRPVPGSQEVVSSPLEDLGGTRHQSSARFVAANRDTVALVVSQDRHVSVVHWQDAIGFLSVLRNAESWV